VQIVIPLIVTPEGLPLAYEVLPGNAILPPHMSQYLRDYLRSIVSTLIWITRSKCKWMPVVDTIYFKPRAIHDAAIQFSSR